MSTFDSYKDSPYQIRTEGQNITIKFEKTSPTTARISWNIPTPAIGCDSSNQAYNGIVVTLDTVPASRNTTPVDGTYYTGDPTANTNLHAGDRISTALVVGALYDDKITTFIDITGISENTPYYVSGYAVDAQGRYHTDGVHAYSMPYGNPDGDSTPGYHSVCLGTNATDPTGLVPTSSYNFTLGYNGEDPQTITIDGSKASTVQSLIDEINKQIALIGDPLQSPTAPNINEYFYDSSQEKLYKWNGTEHIEVPITTDSTDPSTPTIGDFWYDTSLEELKEWDGASWVVQTFISYHRDFSTPSCDDYWFTGTEAYHWNGTIWLPQNLIIGGTDPSLAPTLPCPYYWYDETNELLNVWNGNGSCDAEIGTWTTTLAIMSLTDPTTPAVNDYWFDETNNVLKQWDGAAWNEIFAQITIDEPTTPGVGLLWYNPTEMVLQQWNGSSWDLVAVIVWETEPNVVEAGSLWWNETTDELYVWDGTTSSWDLVANFVISATDPSLAPTLPTNTVWYVDGTLYCWDGSRWNEVTFISSSTDPTILTTDSYWFDTTTSTWNSWNGTSWDEIHPTELGTDPYVPVVGSFWYNTTNNLLNQWNGVSWINTPFSTIPYTPSVGQTYYNTVTNTLMVWNAVYGWQTAILPVTVTYDASTQCITFTSSTLGSTSIVAVEDIDLFSSMIPVGNVGQPYYGTDGVSGTSSYAEIGVGDDGSPDERRELMDSIRSQLGYPVVEVELTKYQLDTAVQSAIEALRKRSSSAYKRAFFFLELQPGQQRYILTNKTVGFNKIVDVTAIYRMQSSFFGSAEGQGLYGQLMLQHLYAMGSFDLISYHIVSEYVELMNQMFSTHIQYLWDEDRRTLDLLQTFGTKEKVLVDAVVERTEQEMFRDRWTKSWIEKYALATARMILAEIRGKYASLPGAGGGVSLNAAELVTSAERDIADCLQQLDDFIVNNVEDYGMATQFVIG